jgi:hypothetical protein
MCHVLSLYIQSKADMENEGRLFKFDKDVASVDAIRRTIDNAERHIITVLKNDKLSPVFGIALHGTICSSNCSFLLLSSLCYWCGA